MEEQVRSENPEGIFIYSTHPVPPLKDVPSLLKQSDPTPLKELKDFDELKQSLREISCGCVVFDVKEATHLKQLAEVAHMMRSEISSGIIQFIVLCQLEHPRLQAILDKISCNKVLYPPYSAKGLKITLTRHLAIARKAATQSELSQEMKVSGGDSSRGSAHASQQKSVREIDALKTSDDCWLTKASSAKCIHGKWLCFAIGPGPVTGTWVELKSESNGRRFDDRVWEWKPKDPEKDLFIRQGSWRFRGRFPEFKGTSWTFIGSAPELSYFKDGALVERRIYCESNGDLTLARNSRAALDKLPDIQASIDFEVYLKRGGGKGTLLEYVEKRKKERELSATMDAEDVKDLELQLEKELERAAKDFISTEEEKHGLELNASNDAQEGQFADGKFGQKSVEPQRLELFKKSEALFKSKSRLFQLIPSDSEKRSRIQDACQWKCPVILWTAKRQIKELSSVTSFGEIGEEIRIAYPKGFKKEQLLNELSRLKAEQVYLNINTRRTAIFFAQEVAAIRFEEDSINVGIPEFIYEVQRREFLRHQVSPTTPIHVLIGTGMDQQTAITGYAKDLGAGGIQIEHPLSDSKASVRARRLDVGDVFPNVSFEIYGRTIHCSAQLRWKKEIPGVGHGAGQKAGQKAEKTGARILMGLQFVKINPEDREGIRLFVMEESFDYIESILNSEEETPEVQVDADATNS